jgi:hypothetical protein
LLIGVWSNKPRQERSEAANSQEKREALEPPVVIMSRDYLWRLEGRELEARVLTLWKYQLVKPAAVESENDCFRGDLAFVLIDSETSDPQKGRVVWISYGLSRNLAGDSAPLYNWDILPKMAGQTPHVVAVRSEGRKLLALVYHLDPGKSLGAYPLSWDTKDPKRKGWPYGAKPFAFKEFTIQPKPGEDKKSIGIESIKAIRSGSNIVVSCQRIGARLPALHYKYNLDSKQWSEMTFKDKENAGKD